LFDEVILNNILCKEDKNEKEMMPNELIESRRGRIIFQKGEQTFIKMTMSI